ncbi:MAG: adenylate/guanylate cyclase domain-containing protein, partial [Actinomycetota bacterium]|nr:adenylate/guanylate cyclase domain-containing protein [Actinomycetota bacterium]
MTISVLFTDLVGSTALLAQLGGEADAVRRAHFVALRRALAAHRGEEVKSLGDGLMAVFRSAVDAVDCGVAMQQAMSRLSARTHDISLAIRVGISVGEATSEGDDWFGTPVVEAARLCDAAEGGQVLVSNLLVELVRPRTVHQFDPVGGLPLKGLPQP